MFEVLKLMMEISRNEYHVMRLSNQFNLRLIIDFYFSLLRRGKCYFVKNALKKIDMIKKHITLLFAWGIIRISQGKK